MLILLTADLHPILHKVFLQTGPETDLEQNLPPYGSKQKLEKQWLKVNQCSS
jgi:hypothetical protein